MNCSERVKVLQGEPGDATCPFSGFLIFESPEIRDRVQQQLIEAKIYPAILWPPDKPILEGVSTENQELSRRALSLHCDMRYTEQDMQRVAALISRACEEEVR
ncbi:MAG: hypothetical protein KAV87_04925 [Desulfobacteraceae bacterium]|nr:hypothetical protein [Desulfobacteraceae bacterium]